MENPDPTRDEFQQSMGMATMSTRGAQRNVSILEPFDSKNSNFADTLQATENRQFDLPALVSLQTPAKDWASLKSSVFVYNTTTSFETVPPIESYIGLFFKDIAFDILTNMSFNQKEASIQLSILDLFCSRDLFSPPGSGSWIDDHANLHFDFSWNEWVADSIKYSNLTTKEELQNLIAKEIRLSNKSRIRDSFVTMSQGEDGESRVVALKSFYLDISISDSTNYMINL
ncbi:hypothetical protein JCM33374_g6673 [Metschnikowia sp. JCM 33374]|nr:hypothetical protein JCM33374_g6673 [Metschnikowia sp. JCM 33374]